ncbi:MAG TPA: AAA family ATPase [Candidatus Limnocylindria bacterium]|nr:AAA family ATPase [Candidatus Limnocylindria bacterium]
MKSDVVDPQRSSGLIGRDRELNELLGAMSDAAAGWGRLVLIGGEPGVGKSRLADELANRARELGYLALWGRGWEDAGAPPYWPWLQALRSHVRTGDPADVRRQLGAGAVDVAQMIPEVRQLFPEVPVPSPSESDSARFQLFDSTSTFLRNMAIDRPVLVVIDDLHAADMPSVRFLRFLAGQLGEMRVLVVATYRDVALSPDHPLTAEIGELAREPTTRDLNLRGLQAGAVGEFIGRAAGIAPSSELVASVWRETKGNPLFVGEAVRLLAAEGRIQEAGGLTTLKGVVPAGVRAVINRRIGHVPEATADALAIGSAMGPEFSVEILRRVGDMAPASALAVLDPAVEAGLVVPVAGAALRYRFSHDLVREALYGGLAPSRRIGLHRQIANALETASPAPADADLAELAFHYFQAAQAIEEPSSDGGSEREKAIDYARRAGTHAARSLAYEEAVRLLRMAIALMDLGPQPDERLRTEILLAIGEAQARSGDLVGARSTHRMAAEIARRTGDSEQLARAALGYGGRLHWARVGNDPFLIPMLQDALVVLGGGNDRLRARLLSRLACAWRSSPAQFGQCAVLSQQAVDLARGLDDPATLTYVLAGRFWATYWPENGDERMAIATEMMGLAEAVGDAERTIDAVIMMHMVHSDDGRMAEARRTEEHLRRAANELRQPSQLWLGVAPRTLMALLDGNYALAEELIAEELSFEQFSLIRDERSAASIHTFLLRREQGRSADALPTIRAAVEGFPWYPVHRAALVNALLDTGHTEEAEAVFNDLAVDEFAALYRDNEWLLGIALVSEACARLGDAGASDVLYRQMLPFAGRHAVAHGEGSVGVVDRYLGLLAAAQGRLADAERHLRDAARLNEELGSRPWTAHAQHDLAHVLRRAGDDRGLAEAATLDAAALATARAVGAVALEREIVAAGGDGETSPTPADADRGLSRFVKEGEYWTVSFAGETVRIRDARGMQHLARLLATPGRELHALELARAESTATDGAARGRDADATTDPFADSASILDAEAKAAYRARLAELEEEITEAEAWNDPERAAKAREERSFLAAEIGRAVGLGGRDRKSGSAAERARISVTRAVRSAIARIGEQHSVLGQHLDTTIRTGAFCAYQPDARVPIEWTL